MYICVCHGLTDGDVEIARSKGATTERQVFDHCNVQPQCGSCVDSIRCLLKNSPDGLGVTDESELDYLNVRNDFTQADKTS